LKRVTSLMAGVLALVLVVSSCSGGDDSDNRGTGILGGPTTTADRNAQVEPPVPNTGAPAGQPVTFTARYDQSRCDTFNRISDRAALGSPAAIIRIGVQALASVAQAGNAKRFVLPPPNVGPCAITVTWSPEEVAVVNQTAAAWGVDPDQLQHLGGQTVLAIIYRLAVRGG
jgi:hypothetical protein